MVGEEKDFPRTSKERDLADVLWDSYRKLQEFSSGSDGLLEYFKAEKVIFEGTYLVRGRFERGLFLERFGDQEQLENMGRFHILGRYQERVSERADRLEGERLEFEIDHNLAYLEELYSKLPQKERVSRSKDALIIREELLIPLEDGWLRGRELRECCDEFGVPWNNELKRGYLDEVLREIREREQSLSILPKKNI